MSLTLSGAIALSDTLPGVTSTFEQNPALLVGIGGAFGAVMRHLVYLQFESDRFPWSTLLVNVVGSFVFALVLFAGASEPTIQLVGIGICGAFTTFSTFSVETVMLVESEQYFEAVMNALGTLVAALGAVGGAWLLVSLLA